MKNLMFGMFLGLSSLAVFPSYGDTCATALFKNKGQLYAIQSALSQKAEKVSDQIQEKMFSYGLQRSPDCRWVAGFGTQLIDLTKAQKPVELGGLSDETWPIFSPDSKWLLYSSPSNGQVYSINLATMASAKVQATLSDLPNSAFIPTKDMVVFKSETELRSASLDGSQNYLLDKLQDSDSRFVITADGEQVIYTQPYYEENRVEIILSDIKGSSKKKIFEVISSDPKYAGYQAFASLYVVSPDKKNLLLSATTFEGGFIQRLIAVDIENGSGTTIASGPQNIWLRRVSPDFSRVFYYELPAFYSSNLNGTGKVKLIDSYSVGVADVFDFSKDGTKVIRTDWQRGIIASNLDGSEEIKLLSPESIHGNNVVYSKENGMVYYLQSDKDGFTQLFSVDISNGKQQLLLNTQWDVLATKLVLSTDNKHLVIGIKKGGSSKMYRLFGFNFSTQKLSYLDELNEDALHTFSFGSERNIGG